MRALVVIVCLAETATAQPTNPVPGQYVRLTLNDGRTVDGQLSGFDTINYFIQTPQGYFSILRANVTAMNVIAAPPPPPSPPPVVVAPPPPVSVPVPIRPDPKPENKDEMGVGEGLAGFGISYAISAIAAAAKTDTDENAKLGFIPLAGPCLWAGAGDDDEFGKDGYDWLAILGSSMQLAGIWVMLSPDKKSNDKSKVTFISGRDYSGVSVIGSF